MKKITLLLLFTVMLFASCGSSPLSKAKKANEDLNEAAKNNDINAYCRALMDYSDAVCECETFEEFEKIAAEVTQVDSARTEFLSSLPYEEKEKIDALAKMCNYQMQKAVSNLSKDIYRDMVEKELSKDFQ